MGEQGVVLPLNEDQVWQIHSMTGQHVASMRVVADFQGVQRSQGLHGVQRPQGFQRVQGFGHQGFRGAH
ncbi:hypothetical protein [Paraburkholderia sp. BR14427]|uniref:hypothetical protein n=1 Tax=unclassified Paraburkholderia TaxID=2615204 RepID=UPI0034CE21FC